MEIQSRSPIGARRVKTDLQTSENMFIQPGRSRSNSPLLPRHHPHNSQLPSRAILASTSTTMPAPSTGAFSEPQRLTVPPSTMASSRSTLSPSPNRIRSLSANVGSSPGGSQRQYAFPRSPSRPLADNSSTMAVNSISARSQLPARATRLLTRRLQNNATPTNCGTAGSESPRSMDSLPRRTALSASYKTATLNQFNNNNITSNGSFCGSMTDSASTATNSAEDLTLLDKSLRNSMLQDVVHFKKQLVRLRRILQEDEENLMMTDTLNPFENNNGQFFTTTATAPAAANGGTLAGDGLIPATVDSKQQENTLIKESGVVALALLEDQRQELADLRRQGEITAKDRTIRQQQNLIEKYEAEREKLQAGLLPAANGGSPTESTETGGGAEKTTVVIDTATQTERLRPLSFGGQEGLASRNELPASNPPHRNGLRSANHQHHHHGHHTSTAGGTHTTASSSSTSSASRTSSHLKPKTQISSVYAQLSSVKSSGQNGGLSISQKRSSLAASNGNLSSPHNISTPSLHNGSPLKTVRTTLIGHVPSHVKAGSGPSSPPSSPPANGSATTAKVLKSSIRTPTVNGSLGHLPSSPKMAATPSPKRTSAIRPPSSFGHASLAAELTTPTHSHKSKSAPATPTVENKLATSGVVVPIAIDEGKKQNGFHESALRPNSIAPLNDTNNNRALTAVTNRA
ncbi:uncharacterized protein LOC129759517 isoform X2 [Uranotaenia lowii]|uniref:uncharacterized protein LOC129759517 isoform X2 n=1 Tax=Uranotaenia lowii TaxID=190385 RepID=UPI00247A2770|nr:uncharacterized protein LOC129759517 isoform X2 [Uranotaenia lowii]